MKYPKEKCDDAASDAYVLSCIRKFEEEHDEPVFYVNESNGIQALPILLSQSIPARFCYIRSTLLERQMVSAVISDLPDSLLFDLASGKDVAIIDYGCRKDRSRAVYQGVPFIEYALNRFWFDLVDEKPTILPRYNRNVTRHNASELFDRWYKALGKSAKKKMKAFAQVACESDAIDKSKGIRICGISAATTRDGDKVYYAKTKSDYFAALDKMLQGATGHAGSEMP